VDSQHESVLLLLGTVQYINGGGKKDSGMSDLALVLRGVGNGEQHRVARVVFGNGGWHFKNSEIGTLR
jgi:hypothetical protein